jgi:hypothetical protein
VQCSCKWKKLKMRLMLTFFWLKKSISVNCRFISMGDSEL